MELEQAVYQHLIAQPAITALVGDRIYPDDAPPGAALPYVLHEEAEQVQLGTLTGVVNLSLYRMHMDCFAQTNGQAKAIRRAIRDSLLPLRGDAGSGAIKIKTVILESSDTTAEPVVSGEEMPVRRAGLDLLLGYSDN